MEHFLTLISTISAISILLTSCVAGPSASVARSSLNRQADPAVPADDVSSLVAGNNAFALDLYRSVHSDDGNIAFSPYSLSLALGMTYAGARGNTETQMAQTMHYTLPQDRLHPAINRLDLDLVKQSEPSGDEHPLTLKIANAVWAEQTHSFLQDYLDRIAVNYGAGIQLANFINKYEAVRGDINQWVSRQTEDKIKDLIPQGAIDSDTRLVLVNAIYFKADWLEQFDPADTHTAPFTLLDGSQVQVPLMSNHLSAVPYSSGDGYQTIELAYQGNTAAMDFLVPDSGRFENIESGLDATKLDRIFSDMQPTTIQVGTPHRRGRSRRRRDARDGDRAGRGEGPHPGPRRHGDHDGVRRRHLPPQRALTTQDPLDRRHHPGRAGAPRGGAPPRRQTRPGSATVRARRCSRTSTNCGRRSATRFTARSSTRSTRSSADRTHRREHRLRQRATAPAAWSMRRTTGATPTTWWSRSSSTIPASARRSSRRASTCSAARWA